MKRRNKAILFGLAVLSVAITAIHFANKYIFSLAGKKNKLNSVWKSEYGDIAFTEEGEGKPLLLVHGIGIGAGCHEWDKNVAELAKNHRVYAIDLPGFGNSEKAKISYNSYYYAKIINDFISKIIGEKADVAAMNTAGGFVLAGALLNSRLYGKIIVINPYERGNGSKYFHNGFVQSLLPFPIIGTLVYNYISSRQNIMSFIDNSVPITENYADIKALLEKQYEAAHKYGANNKYAVISFLKGYMNTGIFELIKKCPVQLNLIISADSPVPLIGREKNLSVTEFRNGGFYPNIYESERFNLFVNKFFSESVIVEEI